MRRPNHHSLLKAVGATAAALGLATAFTTPATGDAPAGGFTLAAAPHPLPRTAVAAEPAAPSRTQAYGVIGFSATAEQRAKPPTARPSADAAKPGTARASRSIRRGGFAPELGLTQHGLVVLNAIRDNFPQIHSFGGFRAGDMDHGTGNAVDTMIASRAQGDAVAAFVMAHAAQLDVKYIIWRQRIWYPSSGAWRGMADRGSPTANHYDHVHVSVN